MKAKSIAIMVFLCLGLFSKIEAQIVIPEGIYSALKVGNSKELAKYFNGNIELVILDKEGVYSKPQAELILKDFFAKNVILTPNGFMKLHEGGKESSKYVIGTLYTSKGRYRVYLVVKNINNSVAIHQLRIEDDNN